jgi:hypothetical protein
MGLVFITPDKLGEMPGVQAQALANVLKEHATLKSLCGNKGDETELDMSGKGMRAWDAIMLAPEIADNGALSVLNLASNNLGELVPPEGWTKTGGMFSIVFKHADGREQKEDPGSKPEGIIAIANAIPGMGALSVLSLSDNHLWAEGGKALAEGLKDNQLIAELNMSNNYLGFNSTYEADTSGVISIATVIPSMGALIKIDISSNGILSEQDGGLKRLCTAGDIDLVL